MNRYIILFVVILSIIISCERQPRKKATASGRTSEMLVIMEKKHWEGNEGEIIRYTFGGAQPMLPQREPMFDLRHVDKPNFSSMFETHRSILMVTIDPTLERERIETRRDVWAYPQRVVTIYAPDADRLESLIERNEQQLIDMYLETERERLINAYKRMSNEDVRKTLNNKYNVNLLVPQGYFLAIQKDNFVWLRRTGTDEDLEMGLMLTILPYTDPDKDFDHNVIWSRRDSITREHISGQLPDSYMTTYDDIPPDYKEINFKDRYAVKLRGLWKMEGDFMGGPFVNYTMVDELTNRLINLDVFVWAPDFDKRDYLRQLEAIVYTLEFPGEEYDYEEDIEEEPITVKPDQE